VTAAGGSPPDPGQPDGRVPDGGAPDGGAPDGAVPDRGAPDDRSRDAGQSDGGEPAERREVLVVPVTDAGRLATVCALAGVSADVAPIEAAGCAVVPDPGAEPDVAAAALSKFTRKVEVVQLVYTDGQVAGSRWVGGRPAGDVQAGLVLSAAPDLVGDLLLGRRRAEDVEGTATSRGMDRRAAARQAWSDSARQAPGWAQWVSRWTPWIGMVLLAMLLGSEIAAALAGSGSWLFVALWAVGLVAWVRWSGIRVLDEVRSWRWRREDQPPPGDR
jgi:hypothetical protein